MVGRLHPAAHPAVSATLPPGWRVERLGLIGGVEFTHTDGRGLLWCDGHWTVTRNGVTAPAPGIPVARTMAQARTAGAAFLSEST